VSRLTNYIFIFVLVYLFILEANSDDHSRIFIAVTLSIIFSYSAFLLKWLSLDGARAASVFGIIALGIGGWFIALSALLFFVSSSLLSSDFLKVSEEKKGAFSSGREKNRRTGSQVWSNGFFLALFSILWFLTKENLFLLAAFSAVATATADTWATEVGSKTNGNTYLITNFSKVEPGSDGGVSFKGTFASILGSFLIAITCKIATGDPWSMFYIIFISGFSGSLADSYLGAILQHHKSGSFYNYMERFIPEGQSNNAVNLMATGIGSITALILIIWI
jgi:uncharacterized protein (TIGR00297 family)